MTRRASLPLESTVKDVWVASVTCALMNASHPFQFCYQKILHVDTSSVTKCYCYSNSIFEGVFLEYSYCVEFLTKVPTRLQYVSTNRFC